jgi:fructose-specific phosphotransferase system IIC component
VPIQVIFQIKHFGETGAGEPVFVPCAVVGLVFDEPVDAGFDGGIMWAMAARRAMVPQAVWKE